MIVLSMHYVRIMVNDFLELPISVKDLCVKDLFLLKMGDKRGGAPPHYDNLTKINKDFV